jgi:hypothetical protein
MSEKERKDYFERYRNVDEYDAVLRWHCRLNEPKPQAAREPPRDQSTKSGALPGRPMVDMEVRSRLDEIARYSSGPIKTFP